MALVLLSLKSGIFIIFFILPKIVYSTECYNPYVECMDMCCEEEEYYDVQIEICLPIPENVTVSWNSILHANNTISENVIPVTVEYVEFGDCEADYSLYDTIPMCYAPVYHEETEQFYLKKLTDVPCDRLYEIQYFTASFNVLVSFILVPICLPLMLIYTCMKKEDKFTFNLLSCYIFSMGAYILTTHTASVVGIYYKDMRAFELCANTLASVFFASSCLWLNVIGYELWKVFKKPNAQNNPVKDGKRFTCYFILVWILAIAITWVGVKWKLTDNGLVEILYPFWNIIVYVYISVNICLTRCRVVHLTNEAGFRTHIVCTILHIGLMMGIPRMLIIAMEIFVDVHANLIFTIFILEPFVVFTGLVWRPRISRSWSCMCCMCNKTEEEAS